jgi:hypothetical protein
MVPRLVPVLLRKEEWNLDLQRSEHFLKSAFQNSLFCSGALTVETAYLEISCSLLICFFRNTRAAQRKRVNWNIAA